MSFWAFCWRRLGQTLFVLFGVLVILFFLFHVAGGDPALLHAGKNADTATIESIRHEMGLDRSLGRQFIHFVKDAALFQWGLSWSAQRPVSTMIWEGLWPSVMITFTGFLIAFAVAIALAFASVHWQGSVVDKFLSVLVAILMSTSFIVIIMFMQKTFAYSLDWFPIFGWERGMESWRYVALPCFIYVMASFSPKFLLFRALVREELEKRYVLTAQSKGLEWSRIYFSHILKNIWPVLITLASAQIPALLTGSLLLEMYFGIPGIGHLLLKSIQNGDFPVVKALTVFGSLAYITSLFIGDVLSHALFPEGDKT